MKTLLSLLAVVTVLGLAAPSANAMPLPFPGQRQIVNYLTNGAPVYAVYQIVGYDAMGYPIYQWVTQPTSSVYVRPHYGGYGYGSYGYGGNGYRSYNYRPTYVRPTYVNPYHGHVGSFGHAGHGGSFGHSSGPVFHGGGHVSHGGGGHVSHGGGGHHH